MRATSEVVEGNKVRLCVEVDEPEVDRVLVEAVRNLSHQLRVPGFRPGKVPRQVLEARMGGAVALRTGALREAIPELYAKALAEVEIDPIAPPEIDITAGEEAGALSFDAVVEVRPLVAIPGYAGLRVTVPSPAVTEAEIDAQVDRMRETEAELVEVDRPARDGDHVTVDVHGRGPDGDEVVATDDLLYEVGSGQLVPGIDEELRGAKVGDVLAFEVPTPVPGGGERTDTEGAAGGEGGAGAISFRVLVKDVKEKKLPALTDDWAAESSEQATVAELREDLRSRLGRVKTVQAQFSLRDGAMASLIELVEDDDVPETLVEAEVSQRVHDLGHRLEERRIGVEELLAATGRTRDELLAEVRAEAHRAVKGDLALRALAEEEALTVSDEELAGELAAMAEQMRLRPEEVRDRLVRSGRLAAVRSERRKAKALSWLVDHVEVVDEEGNPVPREELRADQSVDAVGDGGAGMADRADGTEVDDTETTTGRTEA